MSILEALISITVAAGIFAGATEAWRSAIARSELARADTELTLAARALLLQATATAVVETGTVEGGTPAGVRWSIRTTVPPERSNMPRLAEIEVSVELAREGPPVTWRLAALKLIAGPRP